MAARINRGRAVAAGQLGSAFTVYRPANPMQPLVNAVGTLQAVIDRDPDCAMRAPPGYGDAARYLLADSGALQVGDILLGGGATCFVAELSSALVPLVVDCNAVLQILTLVPSSGYGGVVEQSVAAGWPGSVRLGGRGGSSPAELPGDPRLPLWDVLLPILPGVALASGMRIVDAAGRRLSLGGVEQSALGYRIQAFSDET